ncbi:MAG TPA: ATP-binding cassette domain-containing protein [Polyangia bacterium]|nr:ATP-binding cassette domain-containing protein [Polyangia bacterium]
MLRILGVSVRMGEAMVLDEVALQARAGELVVVEGGRGAGKTTLLQVAATLRWPDAGEVWVAGRDVLALQRASLPYVRRNVGYFSAGVPLLQGMTALENVMLALGARGADPARARELGMRALGRVGALGAATRRVESLSTAECRLCGVARALAGAPSLILLDDPSAGLAASDTGAVLSALLGAVEAGAAALCVSADGSFVAAAVRAGARRVRLEAGRVLVGGGPVGVVGTRRPDTDSDGARVETRR